MHWYVLRTLSGKEESAMQLLQFLRWELSFFYPKRRLRWRKKGHIIEVTKPFLSGYMFVQADRSQIINLDSWLRYNKVDIWLLRVGGSIMPIYDEEIQLIRRLAFNSDIVECNDVMKIGDEIKIIRGPLAGLEGIVVEYAKKNRRIVIKIFIMGDEKRVELDGFWVRKNCSV